MIDWKLIRQNVVDKFKDRMIATPQPTKWHGEGNVYVHTVMVAEALESMEEYKSLPETQKNILLVAALLHDIGKVATTKETLGEIEAPHHAPVGSRMARETLWFDQGLCGGKEFQMAREAVCLLVRYHSFPPHAINDESGALKLHRIAANSLLVPDFSVRLLCILAKADMMGRICDDRQEMLDRISLCEELAKEEGCFESCYPFPSGHTQHVFLSGRDVWKNQLLHDDTWGEVIVMCGLPGVGKDTWIRHNCPDLPMISLDEIRKEKKIPPTANQGLVANIAHERAKNFLRKHQPFVWNATNLTTQMRESLVSLFETYHARVCIVYLETDWQTNLSQNANRPAVVPPSVIKGMLTKLNPPIPSEATSVIWA